MNIQAYNNIGNEYDYEKKLVKCFIRKNLTYLYLFENNYDIMFNELFTKCLIVNKDYRKEISNLSTFIFAVLRSYCNGKYRKANTNISKILLNSISIDTLLNLPSSIDIIKNIEINEFLKYCPKILKEFYIYGYTTKELSKKYNITQQGISLRLIKSLKVTKEQLIKEGYYE